MTDDPIDPFPFPPCVREGCKCDPELSDPSFVAPSTVIPHPVRLGDGASTDREEVSVPTSSSAGGRDSIESGARENTSQDFSGTQENGEDIQPPDRALPAGRHSSDEDEPERVFYLLSATRIPARHRKLVHTRIQGKLEVPLTVNT